eukprot:473821-Prymnesium_polylepis.1
MASPDCQKIHRCFPNYEVLGQTARDACPPDGHRFPFECLCALVLLFAPQRGNGASTIAQPHMHRHASHS